MSADRQNHSDCKKLLTNSVFKIASFVANEMNLVLFQGFNMQPFLQNFEQLPRFWPCSKLYYEPVTKNFL